MVIDILDNRSRFQGTFSLIKSSNLSVHSKSSYSILLVIIKF